MLLFQFPEWSVKDWNREMHLKCTYNGVQLELSETEFPKNWLTDGIQIKILFPFCLGVIPSQENLPSKSSDWGLPPRWKNYILALGIFPTQANPFLS